MTMPGRNYSSNLYRYGFNGKENDNEIKGEGNSVAYENRIYDTRLGRWLSLDPLQAKYPSESHYAFVSNNPIVFKDLDGRDKVVTISTIGLDGVVTQITRTDKSHFDYTFDQSFKGGYIVMKRNTYIHQIIDLRKSGSVELQSPGGLLNSFSVSYGEWQTAGYVEWVGDRLSQASTWVRGDNSGSVKYGYRILGSNADNDFITGLPRAANGSEVLDLSDWLEFVGDMRDGEDMTKLWEANLDYFLKKGYIVSKDMEAVKTAANLIQNASQNAIESLNKIQEAVNSVKKADSQSDPTGKIDETKANMPMLEPGKASTKPTAEIKRPDSVFKIVSTYEINKKGDTTTKGSKTITVPYKE